jgi:hypothetical protein
LGTLALVKARLRPFLFAVLLTITGAVQAGGLRQDLRTLQSLPSGKAQVGRVSKLTLSLIQQDPDNAARYLQIAARKISRRAPFAAKFGLAQRAADTLGALRPPENPVTEGDVAAVEAYLNSVTNGVVVTNGSLAIQVGSGSNTLSVEPFMVWNGGTLTLSNGSIGGFGTIEGSVFVSGGTGWNGGTPLILTGGTINVASGQTLSIANGGVLNLGSNAVLNLTSGGVLNLGTGGVIDLGTTGLLNFANGGVITGNGFLYGATIPPDLLQGGNLVETAPGTFLLSLANPSDGSPSGTIQFERRDYVGPAVVTFGDDAELSLPAGAQVVWMKQLNGWSLDQLETLAINQGGTLVRRTNAEVLVSVP